ncbi:MAG: molybdopterin-dependent oxidoreductase [Alphaproteobacteria bacterium]|nr:molybdopterin-dependent oxidoreductase [Alphaproteobacteria bacterium]
MDDGALRIPHSSHWGAFSVAREGERIVVVPHPDDPDPSPLLRNIAAAARHRARIARPMIRRGWLERGPGPDGRRGADELVAVGWDEALDRVAAEVERVYRDHGAEAVFGGSYGWASAGRFHHAQSQVHRFLNTLGGYVRSVNSYSAGAAAVILPRVLGALVEHGRRNFLWPHLATHTDLVVAFGGMAIKNSSVGGGGTSRHVARGAMAEARRHGTEFVLVGPLRDDLPAEAQAQWQPIIPGTDVALMLGIAHTLVAAGLHDRPFLDRWCAGYPVFEDYLTGRSDGQAKDAAWAAAICGVPADAIAALARRMAGRRTLVVVSQSLQRAEHGEQPVWMGLTLAAMLGQVGLEGGGFVYGLGSLANIGKPMLDVPTPTMPQGQNPIRAFIPVARIADMLLRPGEPFDYDGRRLAYPDIRLVYWAGGNPFHHHQDLARLRRAFARPDTLIVHESVWTATARHADIVLPTTVTLEREDIGAAAFDPNMVAMHRVLEPYAEARDDYAIFAGLAQRLGVGERFTEGRTPEQWLRVLYETTRKAIAARDGSAPDFDTFWRLGELALPVAADDLGPLADFRRDPEGAPLPTATGRIEIYSETIAGFGYPDCPGHPTWMPPTDGHGSAVHGRFPLQLVANQPATRLHSQLDFGACSADSKIRGREPVRIHPADAAARGIADGDVVRLHNERGACLAGAVLSTDVRQGVVQLATGAWYDPEVPGEANPLCVHGNPNVLTRDVGTSRLAQGCTGQLTCVEVERFAGNLPPIRAFDPPDAAAGQAACAASSAG